MKQVNNYWVDENNNNKWNCDYYTKERAQKLSKTLNNCSDCSDCSYCRNCRNCSDCSDCSYCRNCRNCSDCRNCSGCSGFQTNPQRYTTPEIGSRYSQTTFYWLDKNKTQVVCGCFNGSVDLFKHKIILTHGENKFAKQYFKEIEKANKLIFD